MQSVVTNPLQTSQPEPHDQLNPQSHFGKFFYSYYKTYDLNEIQQRGEDSDDDYVPEPPVVQEEDNLPAKKREKQMRPRINPVRKYRLF